MLQELTLKPTEVSSLQTYLRTKLSNDTVNVTRRPNQSDSVEVNLGSEFIGVIYRDEDEGEVSYQFHMTILEEDLV